MTKMPRHFSTNFLLMLNYFIFCTKVILFAVSFNHDLRLFHRTADLELTVKIFISGTTMIYAFQ